MKLCKEGKDPEDDLPADFGIHKRIVFEFKAHTLPYPLGTVLIGSTPVSLDEAVRMIPSWLEDLFHRTSLPKTSVHIIFAVCEGGEGTRIGSMSLKGSVIKDVIIARTVLRHAVAHRFRSQLIDVMVRGVDGVEFRDALKLVCSEVSLDYQFVKPLTLYQAQDPMASAEEKKGAPTRPTYTLVATAAQQAAITDMLEQRAAKKEERETLATVTHKLLANSSLHWANPRPLTHTELYEQVHSKVEHCEKKRKRAANSIP